MAFEKNEKKAEEIQKKQLHEAKEEIESVEELIKLWLDKLAIKDTSHYKAIDLEYKNVKGFDKNLVFKRIVGTPTYANNPHLDENQKRPIGHRYEACENPNDDKANYKLKIDSQIVKHESLTFDFTINLTAKASGGLPLIAQGELGLGLGFGITKEKGKDIMESISREVAVDIKPQHKALCRIDMYLVPSIDTFTVGVELTGNVPIKFDHPVKYNNHEIHKASQGGKWLFVPIEVILKDLQDHKLLPNELKITIQNHKAMCVFTGKYTVEKFLATMVIQKQEPLPGAQLTNVNTAPTVAVMASKMGTFTYAPNASLVVEDYQLEAQQLNALEDTRYDRLLNKIFVSTIKTPQELLDQQKAHVIKIFEEAPKAGEHPDLHVTVAPKMKLTGKKFKLTDLDSSDEEENKPSRNTP